MTQHVFKKLIKKNAQVIQKNWLLAILWLILLSTRLPIVFSQVIPFSFDHGKDSLAVLNMILNLKPKLVGPWTSVPGLYFGPAWFYLLLPIFVLTAGHPAAPILLMILILGVQIYLAYQYFGKLTAIIITSSPIWWTISTSAWNPFPMTLISLIILIIIKKIINQRSITSKQLVILAVAAGLGFHFSSAFAIFYPILISLSLIIRKIKLSWQQVFLSLLSFLLPFVPQLIFEFRHNFWQTKALLTYLQIGATTAISLTKIKAITLMTLKELRLAFWVLELNSSYPLLNQVFNLAVLLFFILIGLLLGYLAWCCRSSWSWSKLKNTLIPEFISWLLLPLIGFWFLHFNVWYLLGMMPIIVIIIGQAFKFISENLNKQIFTIIYSLLLILTPLYHLKNFYDFNKIQLAKQRQFLSIKLQALAWIRQQSHGQSFAAYHYVPEVYDFAYQYLYFWQALAGQPLPTEFAYQPQATDYVPHKKALLRFFVRQPQPPPTMIFYIVEQPTESALLKEWWSRQQFAKIIKELKLSDQLTVYQASVNDD
ncbi:MAG: hypothetical protein GF390_02250 [Candidatus Pacebacteria bacterium]|nr:hypothetical protein [Candidatus Paceibacterota bacterium]